MKSLLFYFYRIKSIIHNTGADWDKLAPAIEDAINFAHEYINPEPVVKIDGHDSLEYALAAGGIHINDRFRKDQADVNDINIVNMVSTHSCKKDLVLYRGVFEDVYDLMIENAKALNDIDLFEKGFMQCSIVKGHETNHRTKLRIYVPEGSAVIYLGNVNGEQGSYEVVIQRGAKLKIISADETYINCKLIETA